MFIYVTISNIQNGTLYTLYLNIRDSSCGISVQRFHTALKFDVFAMTIQMRTIWERRTLRDARLRYWDIVCRSAERTHGSDHWVSERGHRPEGDRRCPASCLRPPLFRLCRQRDVQRPQGGAHWSHVGTPFFLLLCLQYYPRCNAPRKHIVRLHRPHWQVLITWNHTSSQATS